MWSRFFSLCPVHCVCLGADGPPSIRPSIDTARKGGSTLGQRDLPLGAETWLQVVLTALTSAHADSQTIHQLCQLRRKTNYGP